MWARSELKLFLGLYIYIAIRVFLGVVCGFEEVVLEVVFRVGFWGLNDRRA